ncbi:hypothetical protein HN51_036079 [Arachis hypogaea]|uniref:Nuclear transcription factor Y subunit n=1 Tax=Arachis hypogaea TaxID=3818 RepID=A0A445A1Q7_ARAHY|nr:nuclear transcription factor Y subunit A-7 isoform X1 [Arachis ipaensis]XP_016189122.1 nuclear transcription factor Y subunit A-7 isoform X1 [Arachis ipaensis]XP_016189123.1 nuclear transcription factor Y subunit A-7 isoform X1 [Arachis ipaensis]XP_025644473.1 nuclear transcription factor Y subunit A-7 isoform X2 [Arachis hypogaea]XP_025644474.1 nuclear transcription factor Y subunit A-7 isoform X2 [Arachis hypogaea]XP_025644475.1 nuclear transcription factor Y subunit A-7 isoform X2 [Arach
MKPFLSLNYPDTAFDCAQIECDYSMAHGSYPYEDPFFAGSLIAYGPQGINQPQMLPQMLGLQSTRVALPLDLAEDGPVYVNAKQYHGILRRRQSRAKLEAQNKLIKNRKPYLHESRHRHALNRVRGSGGRFLSTKQFEQSNAEVVTGAHSSSDTSKDASKVESHLLRTAGNASSITTCSDRTSLSSNSVSRQPEAQLFLAGPANLGRAPVVR